MKENQSLRAQLGMSEKVVTTEISVRDAFDGFDLIKGSDPAGTKVRAFNVLLRGGITTLNELQGLSFYNLLSFQNAGYNTCALIVVILEHYGIPISEISENKKILEAIEKWRSSIYFTE